MDENEEAPQSEAVECEYYVWDPATQQYARTDPHTGEALLRDPQYMQCHFHLVEPPEDRGLVSGVQSPHKQLPYDLRTQCAGVSETASASAARETIVDVMREAESAGKQAAEAQLVETSCESESHDHVTLRDGPETEALASSLYQFPSQTAPAKHSHSCRRQCDGLIQGDPSSPATGEQNDHSRSPKSCSTRMSCHHCARIPHCEQLKSETGPFSVLASPEAFGALPHRACLATDETDVTHSSVVCISCMCEHMVDNFVPPQESKSGLIKRNHWQRANYVLHGTNAGKTREVTGGMKRDHINGFECGAQRYHLPSAGMRPSRENVTRQSPTAKNGRYAETTHIHEDSTEDKWEGVHDKLDRQTDREELWYEHEEQSAEEIVGTTGSCYEERPDVIGKSIRSGHTGLSTSRPWGVASTRATSTLKNPLRGGLSEGKLENMRARLRVAEHVAAVSSSWRRPSMSSSSPNAFSAVSRLTGTGKPNLSSRNHLERTEEPSRDTSWLRLKTTGVRNAEGVCGGARWLPAKLTSQAEGPPGRRLRQHDPVSRGCQLRAAWDGDPFLRQQKRAQFDMKAYDTWLRNNGHLLRAKALELQREEQRLMLLMMQQQYPGNRKASVI
uniref:Uncharacterized protein n=1 Tax=Toxoplasma gondii COUG TaxID=1074873 RepID=A0A2G8XMI0_TOXGO|nr:hypothetical protein TGCOUG_252230 [Toxoplasma gondii COUG]